MKIAFDYQIFGWQVYGGVSRYVYELAAQLASACEQDVAVIAPLHVNQYLINAPVKVDVKGVSVPQLPKTGKIYAAINWLFFKLLVHKFRPDIVHETYYSISRTAPKGAKVILTVYDMIHERFSDYFVENDYASSIKASAVARADHVICISAQTKQDLIEVLGVDPSKISVIHLGFNLTSQARSAAAIKPLRPFLLYVGSRGGYKNFEGLLKAYASSPQLKSDFDLICFGGGVFSDNEKALMQQLGVSIDRVSQVPGNDALLAEYYQSASAFVYPSLYEGFGIPPLEAMSFDCPVVCSNVSSIPEVVGDAAEMFNPYDTGSIRTAIECVVSDSQLREVLVGRGRERIKLFSWERCAQETLDVYRKVLA